MMTTTRLRQVRCLLNLALAFGILAGCSKHYRAPNLPPHQLATVSIDSRATLLSIDGLPPPSAVRGTTNQGSLKFLVGTGCRVLSAKYEESFFIWGDKKAVREGYCDGLLPVLSYTESHNYETLKPIAFFVPVRAGYTYWLTATFTGKEFLPRVVEIEPSGESVARFLPDVPCKGE